MKQRKRLALVVIFFLIVWLSVPVAGASGPVLKTNQVSSATECFKDLSHLQEEMEVLLKSIHVSEFRETIRRALTASIPDAVGQIDGLNAEIESLRKEIQHQVRVEKSAEFILRDITKTTDGPFNPCRRGEVGGYCETLERYYMAKASNLANRGFLQALECYQEQGIR
ncbi:hypothetical protein [Candidatus Nitronereus thalassa]|uniref:Secreted protein n=1 Tax=Candidatus Nitronereus thalassa TaxID=3020898 RepID=A0ABU3K816_9BACT|nr:hypothetical protein [Candidatus Nitronereus thalassa]MDT7042502.1 hypothetical protein [Candidatus Nitronereus thalassa]